MPKCYSPKPPPTLAAGTAPSHAHHGAQATLPTHAPRPAPRAQPRPNRPESTHPRPQCPPGLAPSAPDTQAGASPNPLLPLRPSARTKLPQAASAARPDGRAGAGLRHRVVRKGLWLMQSLDRGRAHGNRGVGLPCWAPLRDSKQGCGIMASGCCRRLLVDDD